MVSSKKSSLFLVLIITLLTVVLAACGDQQTYVTSTSGLEIITPSATNQPAATDPATTGTTEQTTQVTTQSTSAVATTQATTSTSTAASTTANTSTAATTKVATPTAVIAPTAAPTTKAVVPVAIKKGVLLDPMAFEVQTWNNCAPMSALMAMSYYGIHVTQAEAGKALRPNGGDKNDPVGDKHVQPEELSLYIQGKGLRAPIRENGSLDTIRALLSAGVPVIMQQWLKDNDDIGHYRVARGYDTANNTFIFNDSMDRQPKTVVSSTVEDRLWKAYDRRYIPVYTKAQEATVMAILGEDADPTANLNRALTAAKNYAEASPKDIDAWRNLGYLDFTAGDYKGALSVWENHLSKMLTPSENGPYNRFLWYQLWPIQSYNKVGNYQQVIKMAPNEIEHAKVYAEVRYEYAIALSNTGRKADAVAQLKLSISDDSLFPPARDLLAKLGG